MRSEILTYCDQLVASAANGIYQGIIVAAFVALTLRMFGRTNAATRHAIWFCTLLLLVSLLIAHCLIGPGSFSPGASKFDFATVRNPGFDPVPRVAHGAQSMTESAGAELITPFSALANTTPVLEESMKRLDSAPASLTQSVAAEAPRNPMVDPSPQREKVFGKDPGTVSHGDVPMHNVSSETAGFRRLVERLVNPVSFKLALGSNIPRIAGLVLLALWLTVAGLRVLALHLQLIGMQKLKQNSIAPSAGLSELFKMLATQLGVNRAVELRISPTHRSSFLLGFLHPVILLPAEERLEPAEAELVLRHELAHLQRCDDWINLVQHFVVAVFFFHPAFWWISRQLSLEREIACDDHVLQQSGRPQAYALLLANLAARMQKGLPELAPGSSNNKTQLKERIDMILNKNRNASPHLAKTWLAFITSAVATIAVAVICAAPRIVLAQIETAPTESVPSVAAAPVVHASEPALVSRVADVSVPVSADVVLTAPAPAVGAGPKIKIDNKGLIAPQVRVAATGPLAPIWTPTPVALPLPPTAVLATIEATSAPQAPRPPRPARGPRPEKEDSSLEDRLDRLERIIDSLVKQQNPKGSVDLQLKAEKDGMIDRKEIAKIEAFARQQAELARKINSQEIETIKEQAEHEARLAIDQSKRAAVEVEMARKADQGRADRKLKEGPQRQLEALRKQIEMLERQREKLDHEIERLEQDQEKLDEQLDEDTAESDTQLNESKEMCVTQPSAAQ